MFHRLKPSQHAVRITIMLAALVANILLPSATAQPRAAQHHQVVQSVHVPFVGCKSDGQLGPRSAPKGRYKTVSISLEAAQRLAYYRAPYGPGALAPRGWRCFGTYGSSGQTLYVSPEPLDRNVLSPTWKGLTGPAIQASVTYGGTSGRFGVAMMIARVFPTHKEFVSRVIAEGNQTARDFPSGAYPKDRLTYKSKELVEYETPSQTDGLGTQSELQKDNDPIRGVEILAGEELDLVSLSVRLPQNMMGLTPSIIQQVELESAKEGSKK